jgi:hypothetical protein
MNARATDGTVMVTENLPSALTLVSMAGTRSRLPGQRELVSSADSDRVAHQRNDYVH